MAKVLLLNGSSNEHGCTYTALREVADALERSGMETEILQLGKAAIRDCVGCGACGRLGKCVYDDDGINEMVEKARAAQGFVVGTPVYYAHPSGRVLSALDRMFYSASSAFAFKPGAVVASARRAGTTASLDVLTKYFTIAQMPLVSSSYWNMVHGNTPEEVRQDLEGMYTMHVLGQNMAWLIRCIEAGAQAGIPCPAEKKTVWTNFVR